MALLLSACSPGLDICWLNGHGSTTGPQLAFDMSSEEALAEILAAPALPPPAGVTPNFDNPPNSNTLAWFVTTFCMVVATLCLLLRAYVKIWLDKKLRVEEGVLVPPCE